MERRIMTVVFCDTSHVSSFDRVCEAAEPHRHQEKGLWPSQQTEIEFKRQIQKAFLIN